MSVTLGTEHSPCVVCVCPKLTDRTKCIRNRSYALIVDEATIKRASATLSKEEVFIPNKTNPEDKYRINSRETVNLCR